MDDSTREIEAYLNNTREDLTSHRRELDYDAGPATGWKEHITANPALALGVAFGGGVLVGSLLMRRSRNHVSDMTSALSEPKTRSIHHARALATWDHIKGALVGIAAMRLTEAIDDMIPGFQDQFRRVEADARQA